MAVVDLSEQAKPMTMGDIAEALPHTLFYMLGMDDPNFCIQNDEQVTMRKNAKYYFIQAYASGYNGFVNLEATHKVLEYAAQIYPTREFVIPMWCPLHLLENRRLFLDDENWTLYVKDRGNEKGRLLNIIMAMNIDIDWTRERDMNDPATYQWYEDDFYVYIGKVVQENTVLAKIYYLYNSYTPGLLGTALIVMTQEWIAKNLSVSEAQLHLKKVVNQLKDKHFGIVFLEEGVDVNYEN